MGRFLNNDTALELESNFSAQKHVRVGLQWEKFLGKSNSKLERGEGICKIRAAKEVKIVSMTAMGGLPKEPSDLFRLCPQYVMRPPVTENVTLRSHYVIM